MSSFLNEDVQDLTFLISGSPHEHTDAVDAHHHLVEMPNIVGTPMPAANVSGDGRAKLVGPAADRSVTDVDSAFGEHLLDVSQAHGETEIEPNRELDRFRRKPVALEENGFHPSPATRSMVASGHKLELA